MFKEIKKDGIIFTENTVTGQTAEEVYQEWLKNKDKENVKIVSEQEKLNAQLLQQNAEMQIQLEEQKTFNAQILLKLAGGNANV